MDGKLIPQSYSLNKTHQDNYNKLLSKFISQKCNIQTKEQNNPFKLTYENAYRPNQSLNQKVVVKGSTFLIEGKIVCKKCNNYRPLENYFLYNCACSIDGDHFCFLNLTITNLGRFAKVNMQVSVEQTNSVLKNIFNNTIDLQKDKNFHYSWKFEHATGSGFGEKVYFSNKFAYGRHYFTKVGNLTLVCDIEVLGLRIEDQEDMLPGLSERLADRFSDSNINPSTPSDQFDVILCVGNDKIYCDKLILKISSKFFETMFATDMKESKEKEIVLKDIDTETLKSVLTFMYKESIAEEKVDFKLLKAANMYDVVNLKSICSRTLSKTIDQENAADIWLAAYLHNVVELTHDATVYMATNWEALVAREEIRELCQKYPDLIFTISSLLANQ